MAAEQQEILDAPPATPVAEYNPIAAALAQLATTYKGVQYDLTTTAGDKAARAARQTLVGLRSRLEAVRKEIKAPALERCRLIDAEAKRIEGELLALETPIDAQIKADEARRAEDKRRREKEEADRKAGLVARIQLITDMPSQLVECDASQLNEHITKLQQRAIGDDWQEFKVAAEEARTKTLESLRRMHAQAVVREEQALAAQAEAERLARERKELAEQKAAQEAEQKRWREQAEAAEREAAEQRAAEQKRLDDERAELERQRQAIEAAKEVSNVILLPTPAKPANVTLPDGTVTAITADMISKVPVEIPSFGPSPTPSGFQVQMIDDMVRVYPAAVFESLRKHVNARGFELIVREPDDGR